MARRIRDNVTRYCKWPRCYQLVNTGYCVEHESRRIKKYRTEEVKRQDSLRRRDVYSDKKWLAVSKYYLGKHKSCEICGELAYLVHHIVPIQDGGDEYDKANLQAVCRVCHSRVHDRLEREKLGKPRIGSRVSSTGTVG